MFGGTLSHEGNAKPRSYNQQAGNADFEIYNDVTGNQDITRTSGHNSPIVNLYYQVHIHACDAKASGCNGGSVDGQVRDKHPNQAPQNQSQMLVARTLATPSGIFQGASGHKKPLPYRASTVDSAFLSSPYSTHAHYQQQHHQQSLAMFMSSGHSGSSARGEDRDSIGESTGSSDFSRFSDWGDMSLSSSPVEDTFLFNMGMPMPIPIGVDMDRMQPMMGMNNVGNGGIRMPIYPPYNF